MKGKRKITKNNKAGSAKARVKVPAVAVLAAIGAVEVVMQSSREDPVGVR